MSASLRESLQGWPPIDPCVLCAPRHAQHDCMAAGCHPRNRSDREGNVLQGAAPLIANKTYLASAAGILAVEAYHASVFRTKLTEVANTIVPPYGVPVSAIVQGISNLRAKLSKANDDQGIISATPGGVNIVPTDSNSITFARTPGQVLAIVYGMNNATKGLFFPNGTNGAFTMSS